MTGEPHARRAPPLRMTTGALMIWVFAVAVGLAFVKGDIADWLPRDAVGGLLGLAVVSTVFGIPWLSYRMERSPEARKPPTESSRRYENMLVVVLLGWMTAAVFLLGLLVFMILQT